MRKRICFVLAFTSIVLLNSAYAEIPSVRDIAFWSLGLLGGTDSDRDGLPDLQETQGWKIVIDLHGYGTDAQGRLLTTRMVTSSPKVADTDNDGLDDLMEFLIRSDPNDPDTDADGLTDDEEWNQWLTSPVSVDTDGDCRGPNHNLAPNQMLFDGKELKELHTSPTLDDTDGDGRTDYEEFDHPFRTPLVSDLPKLQVEIVDAVDVRLNVEFAEELGQTKQYGAELKKSETHTTNSYSSHTASYSLKLGTKATAGVQAGVEVSVEHTFGYQHVWASTTEDANTTERSYSEYTTDARTRTETAASGSINMGIRLKNTGEITYTLTDLGYTVRMWKPGPSPEDPEAVGTFQTVCTLTPELGAMGGGITLAPGEVTPVIQVAASQVNAARVRELLARPDSLYLEPAFYEVANAEGLDFDFLEEVTRARTARVIIDFGDGLSEEYRVATNVQRMPKSDYAGVTMDKVLEMLGIPFDTTNRKALDATAATDEQVLSKVRDQASDISSRRNWVTILDSRNPGKPGEDFQNIVLQAGDTALLVLVRDDDGDGLTGPEEQHYGTSDEPGQDDTDGDHLTDANEVRGEVFTDSEGHQVPCAWVVTVSVAKDKHYSYPVWSDPRNADQDGDGLTDYGEKKKLDKYGRPAPTDPTNPDTDGDGLPDGQDPFPTYLARVLYVKTDATGRNDGSDWTNAFTDLQRTLELAKTSNENYNIPDDDVAEIWVARGTYSPSKPANNPVFELIDGVGLYGGFQGGETKRSQRMSAPAQSATVLSGNLSVSYGNIPKPTIIVHAGPDVTSRTTLDGFEIREADGDCGLFCEDGLPRLANLFVTSNTHSLRSQTKTGGAGVRILVNRAESSTMTLSNCLFYGNTITAPDAYGGGLYVENKTRRTSSFQLSLVDCQFLQNDVTPDEDHQGGTGGGAYFDSVTVNLDGCRFHQNTAKNGAGGVHLEGSDASILACEFTENCCETVQEPGYKAPGGGGVYVNFSRMAMRNSIVWGNTADDGAGVYIDLGSSAWIINCSIVKNLDNVNIGSSYHSSGIKLFEGDDNRLSVQNSILYGNTGNRVKSVTYPWLQQINNRTARR